eukprot:scpid29089/ scgid13880/ Protein PAT1 homolog 2; PAT1-like protein 2; Protein PAT1 homolog a
MDHMVYDGALLDDSQLQDQLDPDESLNDETFGGGLDDGSAWEQNQAEFERLRQQDLGFFSHSLVGRPVGPPDSVPLESSGRSRFERGADADIFGRSVSFPSSSQADSDLMPPSFFHNDEDSQPLAALDINQTLNRLLSDTEEEYDAEPETNHNAVREVLQPNGRAADLKNQWNWHGHQQQHHQCIPRRTATGSIQSAVNEISKLDLNELMSPHSRRQESMPPSRATPTESSISVSNLLASGTGLGRQKQQQQPPPPRNAVDLSSLLGGGNAQTSSPRLPPSSEGGRLEDIESSIRQHSHSSSPVHDRPDGFRMGPNDHGHQTGKEWLEHMQAIGAPEGLQRSSVDAGMPPRPPHMFPPRPGMARQSSPSPAGPPAPPRPDGRPGYPPMHPPPPNMPPPPMHPAFRGMQPPPWLYGNMPPPPSGSQRMPDILHYPMPPGMRPPPPPGGVDPNWRGPGLPPNFRPQLMPMGPPPPPNMHGSIPPPSASSPSGAPPRQSSQQRHQQQQQQRNVLDYPFVFMTNREKDWILKVQLIQLSKYSSYLDDYYYLRHRQRNPSSQPMLGLPKMDDDFEVKPENPHGRVTIFEGALGGRISAGSVHCPRQTLLLNAPINVSKATNPKEVQSTMHRRRTIMHSIERVYDKVLALEDQHLDRSSPPNDVSPQTSLSSIFKLMKIRPLQERVQDLKDVSLDEHAVAFLSVPKGARLVVRVSAKLSVSEVQSVAGLLCHHLFPFIKRDEDKRSVKALLSGLNEHLQRWSLNVLACLLDMLIAQPTFNKVATVALLIEQYPSTALSFLVGLVESAYRQCTGSPQASNSYPVQQWCQLSQRMLAQLEPHHEILMQHLSSTDKSAYRTLVQYLVSSGPALFTSSTPGTAPASSSN